MSKFTDLVQEKLEHIKLNEAVPTSSGTVGGAVGVAPAAPQAAGVPQPTASQVAAQQQPQQPQQQVGPEQHLMNAFKSIAWAQPDKAVQVFNTAMKNAGNIPGMAQVFQNMGFDPTTGFVYAQQQPQQVGTPGATATNTR